MKREVYLLAILFIIGSMVSVCHAETLYAEGSIENIKDCINDAESGDTVIVKAGTYTIYEQLVIKEGVTLQGETDEDGNNLATFFLEDDSTFDMQVPLLLMKSHTKVLNLNFNGNSENQKNVPVKRGQRWGNGYHNFIGAYYEDDLEVAHCEFYNNLGDGFRPRSCTNVLFHNNVASKGGHDVLFAIQCENVEAYDNYVEPRVNSAFRFMDVTNGAIYNNTIVFKRYVDGVRSAAGPAIQIQNDKGDMYNVEVCGNYIYDSWGPAFWIVGKTNNQKQGLYIHHNVMYDAGGNLNIYWVGGIIASGFDNLTIENNVFDGSFLGAVNFWDYAKGAWSKEATATLENNIFTDSVKGAYSGVGGWGVNNEISVQSVVSSANCYYNNEAGDTRGCSVSSTDYFSDPKEEDTLCDVKWDGEQWIIPGITPREFDRAEGVYDGVEEITDEEIEEFDSIFDIMNQEFTETGRTEQTADDIELEVEKTTNGFVAGGIKIVGFKDQIILDNQTYIPGEDAVLVKYKVIKSPDLEGWTGHIKKIEKSVKIEIKDGVAYATLTVKTSWYTVTINQITGLKKKSKIKTSKATFKDSCPSPAILERNTTATAYVTVYDDTKNPYARVKLNPDNTTQRIEFSYNGNTTAHSFMIGERITDDTGIQYTLFSRCDSWYGDIPHMGNELIIPGEFNPNKLDIKCYTPYESFDVTDIQIEYHKNVGESRLFTTLKFLAQLIIAMYAGYKLIVIIMDN